MRLTRFKKKGHSSAFILKKCPIHIIIFVASDVKSNTSDNFLNFCNPCKIRLLLNLALTADYLFEN